MLAFLCDALYNSPANPAQPSKHRLTCLCVCPDGHTHVGPFAPSVFDIKLTLRSICCNHLASITSFTILTIPAIPSQHYIICWAGAEWKDVEKQEGAKASGEAPPAPVKGILKASPTA